MNSTLRHFFQFFQKYLTDAEISLLLEGKGEWNPTPETLTQMQKIQKYSWIFALIPGLKAVFFCNTTAFRAANPESDIDLFVITEERQLWTARVFLTLLTHILGIRRHGDHIANRFCLSFFATESGAFSLESLQIQSGKDPYLAVWTATAECFIAEKNWLQRFHESNKWIAGYGLHFTQQTIPSSLSCFQKIFSVILKLIRVEAVFRSIFLSRTLKKYAHLTDKKGTIISDQFLKFHDKDIREEIAKSIKM
jgi:hypothetical protein